jgi:hypothetical protein
LTAWWGGPFERLGLGVLLYALVSELIGGKVID